MTHECVGIDYKLETKPLASNIKHHSDKVEFHFYTMNESAFSPPPPAYEDVQHNSSPWEAWYRRLIGLQFNQDEAVEYAKLFVNNEVELDMIPELNDGILKGIGIEKAGHRIRILRLQNKTPAQSASSQPVVATAQLATNAPRCAFHPRIAAVEKCHKCYRLLCLNCRQERYSNGRVRYYCANCYEECIIL